ncbi:unnamed protein product [Sphenostylis stenocarpa]|uniref:Uncharacterized protein n=1 Tax=Sphenostylis stenocarpa TaxID=92480 RepID=A0AA86S8X4_9FABA|nr:unnamed protein product [Sphenostylis stenocarpa]
MAYTVGNSRTLFLHHVCQWNVRLSRAKSWGPISGRLWGMLRYFGALVGPFECYGDDNYPRMPWFNPFGITY